MHGDETVKVAEGIKEGILLSILGDVRPGGGWFFKPPEGSGNINENFMAGGMRLYEWLA